MWLAARNNTSFFFEKIFLKGTSPVDHILQQRKTMLQLTKYFFFWVFEELPHYNSYYKFFTARQELTFIDYDFLRGTRNMRFTLSSGLSRVKSRFYLPFPSVC